MKKLIGLILTLFLLGISSVSEARPPAVVAVNVTEVDGAPSAWAYKLIFPNATVTDNGNGTVTIITEPGGSASIVTVGALTSGSLATGFTPVTVPLGGTGASTYALNGVLYGNAANAIGVTAIGAEGQILRVGASPFVPAWSTSTFANTYVQGGLLHAATANTIAALAPGAVGSFLMSNGASAALSYLAAGAANYILVGAGVTTIPVWTASTGTGAPVLGTSPVFTTSILPSAAGATAIGTTALPFSSIFIGDAATNNVQLINTAAASAVVLTLPSTTGTLALIDAPVFTTSIEAPFLILGTAASAADAGAIRLPNAAYIMAEADAAAADISVIGVDSAEIIQIGASGASGVTITPATTITGHVTLEGVTSTGATGTAKLVFDTTPTLVTPVLGAATATSLIATGIVDGTAPITITATSAGYTIPTPNGAVANYSSGYVFTNPVAAAATFYVVLPPAVAGLQYCVGNGAAKTGILRVTAVGNDQIDLDGTLGTAAGWATATAVAGNFGCFVGVSGTQWKAIPTKGTWTIAGP